MKRKCRAMALGCIIGIISQIAPSYDNAPSILKVSFAQQSFAEVASQDYPQTFPAGIPAGLENLPIPPGSMMPPNIPMPTGMSLPPNVPIPSGMTLPPDIPVPSGMTLPPNIPVPSGMTLPPNIPLPPRMTLPPNMPVSPDMLDPSKLMQLKPKELPEGLPAEITLEKLGQMITENPQQVEELLSRDPFQIDAAGKIEISQMQSEEEIKKMEPSKSDEKTSADRVVNIVLEAFKSDSESIVTKASEIILQDLESVTVDEIARVINDKGIAISGLKLGADATDLKKLPVEIDKERFLVDLPSKEALQNIPEEFMPKLRAYILVGVTNRIDLQVKAAVESTRDNTEKVIETAAPQILELIAGSIKRMVPKIGQEITGIIENKIRERIREAVTNGGIEAPLDENKKGTDAMIEQLKGEISPRVESYLRALVFERIRSGVELIVLKKIEKPILEKMKSNFDKAEEVAIHASVDELPEHMEIVITKDTIKNIVKARVGYIKSKIGDMVRDSREGLHNRLDQFIQNEVKEEVKILLGDLRIESDVKPMNVSNRMMLPFRAIAQALGAEVKWIPEKRQVVIDKESTQVVLTLDSKEATVNGKLATLDVPALVSQGRTMVPVRFLGEALGLKVNWQSDWKTVSMQK